MQQLQSEILELAKSGDPSAFKRLVEHYSIYAYNLAFRILCDEEEAKDAVQDSFIKIWKRIGAFNATHKFSTWMYKIVTHTAIDLLRKQNIRKTTSIDLSNCVPSDIDENSTQKKMDNQELAALISNLSEGLPEKQRMVFILRDIQGFKSTEVQEILEMPEDAVKSNLYYARKSVKEKLTRLMVYERRFI